MVRLICVVGYPGSGKSVAADVAESEFDIPSVTMGNRVRERAESECADILTVVDDAADRVGDEEADITSVEEASEVIEHWLALNEQLREELRGGDGKLDLSHSNIIGSWATVQRQVHGDAVVAEWTADYIRDTVDADTVLVDGVRSCDEYDILADEFETVDVVHIHTPFEQRLERLQERGRDGEGGFTEQQLQDRDEREEDWGVDEIVDAADITIENTGTLDEYEAELRSSLFA